MSAPAFTPGPWEADRHTGRRVLAKHAGGGFGDVCKTEGYFGAETAQANARLIAAAPELYEALDRFLKANHARATWPENDSTKRFDAMLYELEAAEDAAKAALAKARGEQ